MPYQRNPDSGNAEYGSWVQLPDDLVISEGSNTNPAYLRKYARLVYLANTGDISISGGNVTTTTKNYSQYIQTSGNYTYIMSAVVGSGDLTDPVWQMKRIYEDNAGEIQITWADGNDNFDNVANDWNIKIFTF